MVSLWYCLLAEDSHVRSEPSTNIKSRPPTRAHSLHYILDPLVILVSSPLPAKLLDQKRIIKLHQMWRSQEALDSLEAINPMKWILPSSQRYIASALLHSGEKCEHFSKTSTALQQGRGNVPLARWGCPKKYKVWSHTMFFLCLYRSVWDAEDDVKRRADTVTQGSRADLRLESLTTDNTDNKNKAFIKRCLISEEILFI